MNPNDTPAPPAPARAEAHERHPRRRQALGAVAAAMLLGGAAYGAYWALVLNHFERTDNAYVQGNIVQITPQVGGTVLAIGADDTDFVKAGQTLVRLDTADAQVALDQAEAQLAQTVREVRTLYANNAALRAQVALRQADAARAQADLARAQDDVSRRAPLVATGAVGQEEFNHANAQLTAARSGVQAAQSAVAAAKEQLLSAESLTDNTSVEQHPNVQRAAARVREAYLALKRVDLPAPVDGYVAKRNVQLGQRVQAGAPLMTVVGLQDLWVDANFKESQLRQLRIGQPATLTADVYGEKVEYHGVVEGLGAGTGGAFSLLPAQNATGNWIKIVQRVPVRIALNREQVAAHPLRVGLSMEARVDVSNTDGKVLADAPRRQPVAQTQVFDRLNRDADEEVRRIISAHGGRAPALARASAQRRPVTDRQDAAHVVAHAVKP
ncbi:efflux RND transporter periplasmic adaptor subunit [Aquabacterium sp. J223]|uniref:efflux RND transporter periplasmic adaptor subunit n=1 Tax=Aquabacterium sp. J223 TaxID=2898431 RepID=UPI0021ADE3BA|nr:efflux RND transporter periplasmic adaptor subunit [Aquabacterium sp. J223]UUX95806.1 efflux RND transporter periplasmic adaptor subunit [Aquabacterium sp. J223]